ncbi:hypothetical protein LTR04_002110, partial [Oleoguttula sp. CCFEE 6159]
PSQARLLLAVHYLSRFAPDRFDLRCFLQSLCQTGHAGLRGAHPRRGDCSRHRCCEASEVERSQLRGQLVEDGHWRREQHERNGQGRHRGSVQV